MPFEVGHGGLHYLVEIMREDEGGDPHGNPSSPLRQQEGEFGGQRYGLLVPPIVALRPLGILGVEHHIERELGEPRLYVPRGGSAIAREDIAPVALRIYEQILLPKLHERATDGGIAVRMVLHGVPDNVGHLVVPAILEGLHGVEYAPLHGF